MFQVGILFSVSERFCSSSKYSNKFNWFERVNNLKHLFYLGTILILSVFISLFKYVLIFNIYGWELSCMHACNFVQYDWQAWLYTSHYVLWMWISISFLFFFFLTIHARDKISWWWRSWAREQLLGNSLCHYWTQAAISWPWSEGETVIQTKTLWIMDGGV